MGKVVDLGRTQRALDFKSRTSIWLAIGQTSVWPDEENPPDEDLSQSTVDEVVGYKLLTESWLVTVGSELTSTLEVDGVYYDKVADVDADTARPVNLYMKFTIEPDELSLVTYRQVGIFVDLVPTEGNSNKSVLLPSEVATTGRLVYLENSTAVERQAETRHVFETVLPM